MATAVQLRRRAGYAGLALVMLACLWIGWRDHDPWIEQALVRQRIREWIRLGLQMAVQYVIPGAIAVLFMRRACGAGRRRRVRRP